MADVLNRYSSEFDMAAAGKLLSKTRREKRKIYQL
nr:MAG TPA: hypothetical protein [Caudoviricetes sp.]